MQCRPNTQLHFISSKLHYNAFADHIEDSHSPLICLSAISLLLSPRFAILEELTTL
jgi:hypothetical protein